MNALKPSHFKILTKTFTTSRIHLAQARPHFRPNGEKNLLKSAVLYTISGIVFMTGATYASVPLYKMFCELQGIDVDGKFKELSYEEIREKLGNMKKVENRPIKVKFMANTSVDLQWKFDPQQDEIIVAPGETALAFYRAKNLTDRSIVGISTYNILPFEAGLYFNKVQCFCFEEQCLDPKEEVDMPVFFFIDEQFTHDPLLQDVETICLSYTFFESKDSNNLQNEAPKLPKEFFK